VSSGRAVQLFAASALWRATGSARAGRSLVRGLSSPDETCRTVAGMLLARAGARSKPLLEEALARGESVPIVLRLLGDVGARELRAEIGRFAASDDPATARAARDALRALERPPEEG
jgi:hypothetical protein